MRPALNRNLMDDVAWERHGIEPEGLWRRIRMRYKVWRLKCAIVKACEEGLIPVSVASWWLRGTP